MLRAPHTPRISVRRPPRHHESTPEDHPPQDPPATSTHGTTRPTSHPGATQRRQAQPSPPRTTHTSTWTSRTSIARLAKTSRTQSTPPLTAATISDPKPPPSNPRRQGPKHSPGIVPPTRELDQAHRQGPPGSSQPGERPPPCHHRPRPLEGPPAHPRPAHLDPPYQVGPSPDTQHRHQRHTSRDHTPATNPGGEGPPSKTQTVKNSGNRQPHQPGTPPSTPPAFAPSMTTSPPSPLDSDQPPTGGLVHSP